MTSADMYRKYDIDTDHCLGSGTYGKVFKAVDKHDKSISIAIKVINKKGLNQKALGEMKKEVAVLQTVDHPNIVKYYETYEDPKYIYLCQELLTGGEILAKEISNGRPYSEAEAAAIFAKLFSALKHCNGINIMHRDIKAENVMYGNENEIKMIDFGLATISHSDKERLNMCGTPYYLAPEILSGRYGMPCDIWSSGVLLFQVLTGGFPFDGNSRDQLFARIKKGKFDMPKFLSKECGEFLT